MTQTLPADMAFQPAKFRQKNGALLMLGAVF